MLNEEKCDKLSDDVKEVIDLISAELCDDYEAIAVLEKGATNLKSKRYAHRAAKAIRRAGEICAACGIIAKQDWDASESNWA